MVTDQDILNHIFTNWGSKSEMLELNEKYRYTPPYPTLHLDDFISKEVSQALYKESKTIPDKYWSTFTRAGSYMEECSDLEEAPVARAVVSALHSKPFLKWLSKVCDVGHLLPDPYLVGAGYMKSYTGDSLKIHTDFNWNESLKLHRMLSLILYIEPDWKPEYGGDIVFKDFKNEKVVQSIPPKFNRCVIWRHHKRGFHGYPDPITCPDDISRKTFRLFFYVSNATHNTQDLPHRSLYWFDKDANEPYDIVTEK